MSAAISLTLVLACTFGTMALGTATKAPCASGHFSDGRQYRCQLFKMSLLGLHLRQLTRFGTGARSSKGCGFFRESDGCTFVPLLANWFTLRARSLLFYSDCDPFGANPNGSQVFAIDYDGSHLRQLTRTAGGRTDEHGVLELEFPGPVSTAGR